MITLDAINRVVEQQWKRDRPRREVEQARRDELWRRLFRPIVDADGRPYGEILCTGAKIQETICYKP